LADVAKSAPLAERLVAGEKRALARAITLIESDDPAGWELVREVYPRTGSARIVGFTGPPGVGKSTLIGALTGELRKSEREIAVLSIDPSSPFTRGALLGDRIRLTEHFLDPGVFIRSMASRGALGGLSEAALQVALIMDAAGKDDVLIETVGVGQAEIDIVDHADTIVLALMPGSGDSIQALKAGVMEIPDVIVVNKADHPMTDTMVRSAASSPSRTIRRAGRCRSCGPRRPAARESTSSPPRSTPTAPSSRSGGRWPSAAPATCAARCWGSRPRGCGAGSSRRSPRTRRRRSCWTGWCGAGSTRRARRASCWRGTSMSEPAREISAAEAMGWLGAGVAEIGGADVGQVQGLFVDADSGEPAWLIARLGRRRRVRVVAVPFANCAGAPFGVWVAQEGEAIRSAPVVDPTRPLRREHELTICAHFGIGEKVGRAAQVAGRDEGEITATPPGR
jgi:LAO/AO transport system ATPase